MQLVAISWLIDQTKLTILLQLVYGVTPSKPCKYNRFIIHKQTLKFYLVCPHKSTRIAKSPWPFGSTLHHWCRLLTDTTVSATDMQVNIRHHEMSILHRLIIIIELSCYINQFKNPQLLT